jgi:hypothetical protein
LQLFDNGIEASRAKHQVLRRVGATGKRHHGVRCPHRVSRLCAARFPRPDEPLAGRARVIGDPVLGTKNASFDSDWPASIGPTTNLEQP